MTFSFEKYMDLFDDNTTNKQLCYNWFIVFFFFYDDDNRQFVENIWYNTLESYWK